MTQLRADVANKDADTDTKRAMTCSEPDKMFAGVFGAPGYVLGRGH